MLDTLYVPVNSRKSDFFYEKLVKISVFFVTYISIRIIRDLFNEIEFFGMTTTTLSFETGWHVRSSPFFHLQKFFQGKN